MTRIYLTPGNIIPLLTSQLSSRVSRSHYAGSILFYPASSLFLLEKRAGARFSKGKGLYSRVILFQCAPMLTHSIPRKLKRHRVVPPTFHKNCMRAQFRRLGNFSKKVIRSREYLVLHFRLTFCRILLILSFQKIYTFMGFPFLNLLRATPPRKHHVIYPGMIPWNELHSVSFEHPVPHCGSGLCKCLFGSWWLAIRGRGVGRTPLLYRPPLAWSALPVLLLERP